MQIINRISFSRPINTNTSLEKDEEAPFVQYNPENVKINNGFLTITVGRKPENALKIGNESNPKDYISKGHLKLDVNTVTGKITLTDYESTNGTTLQIDTNTISYKDPSNSFYLDCSCPQKTNGDSSIIQWLVNRNKPVTLDLQDKWTIILAPLNRYVFEENFHKNSILMKSDGKGNITLHEPDDTGLPGEALSTLSISLPDETSPSLVREANNPTKARITGIE
jgi:hypothetical protein